MKTSRCIGASLLLMLAVLVVNASAQRSTGNAVIGAGGGSCGGGAIGLQVTLGQPVIGITGAAATALQQGFWYGRTATSAVESEYPETPVTGTAVLAMTVLPNPSAGKGILLADIPAAGQVSAILIDMRGNILRTLFDGICQPGRLNIPLNGADLPAGTYTIVLRSGAMRATTIFHLVR